MCLALNPKTYVEVYRNKGGKILCIVKAKGLYHESNIEFENMDKFIEHLYDKMNNNVIEDNINPGIILKKILSPNSVKISSESTGLKKSVKTLSIENVNKITKTINKVDNKRIIVDYIISIANDISGNTNTEIVNKYITERKKEGNDIINNLNNINNEEIINYKQRFVENDHIIENKKIIENETNNINIILPPIDIKKENKKYDAEKIRKILEEVEKILENIENIGKILEEEGYHKSLYIFNVFDKIKLKHVLLLVFA